MKKKLFMISTVLAALVFAGCGKKISEEVTVSGENTVNPTVSVSTEVKEPEVVIPEATHVGDFTISGDRLTAVGGAYEQDGDLSNGAEPIEWLVISDNGNTLVLLSKNILDCRPFGKDFKPVNWDASFIREWLNNDFYNAAFNDSEKSIIADYATTPAEPSLEKEAVLDKVFLLSYEEAKSLLGGKDDEACVERISPVTEYAKSLGVWTIDAEGYELFGFKDAEVPDSMIGCGNWWLRSNGKNEKFAMDIGASGNIRVVGHEVANKQEGVRPAIQITLSDN